MSARSRRADGEGYPEEVTFDPGDEQYAAFPGWLLSLGKKVHADAKRLLAGLSGNPAAPIALMGLLDQLRIHLIEPLQVSIIVGDQFVYHDYLRSWVGNEHASPVSVPVRQLSGSLWPVWERILAASSGICFWRDHARNNPRRPLMARDNLCFFSRTAEETILHTELHWSPAIQSLAHQAFRARDHFERLRIEVVDISDWIVERLVRHPEELHSLGAEKFELLVVDRLHKMGFEAKRVGSTYQADGGVDVVFWPRARWPIPFIGAAQVKHHSASGRGTGASVVRDLAGAMAKGQFNAGLLVTNTHFTDSATWEASRSPFRIGLRDQPDVMRWVFDTFDGGDALRDLPTRIVLAPGLAIDLPRPSAGRVPDVE